MALKGSAFLIMWHDIAAPADAEYNLWHTRQHMPERLDHPGFLRSRRGVNRGLESQVYFTCYEGESLSTFLSPEYSHSLNNPTDWTRQVAPSFRNFLRMACQVLRTGGRGEGGGLVTSRFDLPEGMSEEDAMAALAPVLDQLEQSADVTAVHLAAARPGFSDQKTAETELRPAMREKSFDLVVFAETIGLGEATRLAPRMQEAISAKGFGQQIVQPYDVAYSLHRRDER
ncbi:MAG: hypothetical protein J7498_12550 [Sphingobium sp.]|nr:hypothetical protein [Sphingobium sp.]